jgi:hypothetical protein
MATDRMQSMAYIRLFAGEVIGFLAHYKAAETVTSY